MRREAITARRRTRLVIFAGVLCAAGLAGCKPAIDQPLVTGEGIEKYTASRDSALAEATELELEAFNWAVSDYTLDGLHATYPDTSPRKIIREEVKRVLDEWPDRIGAAEANLPRFDALTEELSKVRSVEATLELRRDFFGIQPTIHATLENGSELGISSLYWRANLYVDGQPQPVATADLLDNYNNASTGITRLDRSKVVGPSGMQPGSRYRKRFTVGFVKGDETWSTIEIQNAKSTSVTLEPLYATIKDYRDTEYLKGSPHRLIETLNRDIENAKRFSGI